MLKMIDELSKTMTTAQVWKYFGYDLEKILPHLEVCSTGNRLALMEVISKKYTPERMSLAREENELKDVIDDLRGD